MGGLAGITASGALIAFPLLTFLLARTGYRAHPAYRARFATAMLASGLTTLVAITAIFLGAVVPAPLRNADWAEFGLIFLLIWTAVTLWRCLRASGGQPRALAFGAVLAGAALPLSLALNAGLR
jgi:hypothetical protein